MKRYDELVELANACNCTIEEAMREALFQHFTAAGFREDVLEKELGAMDQAALQDVWENIGEPI